MGLKVPPPRSVKPFYRGSLDLYLGLPLHLEAQPKCAENHRKKSCLGSVTDKDTRSDFNERHDYGPHLAATIKYLRLSD